MQSMKILVGSQNPVKIEAAKEAFSKYFKKVEVAGIKVDSFGTSPYFELPDNFKKDNFKYVNGVNLVFL